MILTKEETTEILFISYLDIYTKTIIPEMNIEGLKEQKLMFECQKHPVDLEIHQAICERISELT